MKKFVSILLLVLITVGVYGEGQVKNVILMIGDGMGLPQISYTSLVNGGLEMERAQFCGVVKTTSASSKVTDSAAASTAIACSVKTYNGAIGVDVDKKPVESILEKASKAGFATGLIATYSITNATPAGFIAHNESRKDDDGIALDFTQTPINVFMGGGRQYFSNRSDGRNVADELRGKGYTITESFDEALAYNGKKLGALLAAKEMKKAAEGRGDFLPKATAKSLDLLKKASTKGFFIMVEGSMIDGGGHANDAAMVLSETLDFDAAVKVAFDFADKNPGTLVIVTADHETGGMTLPNKDLTTKFSTNGHTASFVPLFAYGTGASAFSKVIENTDISKIIEKLLIK